eukprot:8506635-Alexandrium_andersonii.AAC.1
MSCLDGRFLLQEPQRGAAAPTPRAAAGQPALGDGFLLDEPGDPSDYPEHGSAVFTFDSGDEETGHRMPCSPARRREPAARQELDPLQPLRPAAATQLAVTTSAVAGLPASGGHGPAGSAPHPLEDGTLLDEPGDFDSNDEGTWHWPRLCPPSCPEPAALQEFDPLQTRDATAATQLAVTHGRAAMLVGLQLPGTISPTDGDMFVRIPRAIGALAKVPAARWIQAVAYGAFCELYTGSASQ